MPRHLPAAAAAALAVGLMYVLQVFLPMSAADLAVPAMSSTESARAGFGSLAAFHRIDNERDASSLPDIALALASAAFQEGFMYGAEFRLPLPDEQLVLTEYLAENGRLAGADRTIVTYDQAWLDSAVAGIAAEPVGRLLLSAGAPAAVRPLSVSAPPAGSAAAAAGAKGLGVHWYLAAALAGLVVSTLIIPQRSRVSGGPHTSLLSVRRRAQAA